MDPHAPPRRAVPRLLATLALAAPLAAQDVDERLDERWRWRELPPPGGEGHHEAVAVDARGRILSWSRSGLARYDGTWTPLGGAPEGEVVDMEACASGLVVLLDDRYHAVTWEGEWRALPIEAPALLDAASVLQNDVFLASTGPGEVAALTGDDRLTLVSAGRVVEELRLPQGYVEWCGALRDSSGDLWITTGGGIFRRDGAEWTPVDTQPERGLRPRYQRILEYEGDLWFFPSRHTGALPVLRWDGTELAPVSPPLMSWDAALVPGLGLVATDRSGEVRVFDGASCRSVGRIGDVDDQLQDLAVTPDGALVARSYSGRLWLCDLASERWRAHAPRGPVGLATVHDLARDGRGGLWLGTSAGVVHFDGERFGAPWTEALGIPLDVVTAVHVDERERLWVGSGASFPGALVLDGGTWEHVVEPFGENRIHAVRRAPGGDVWFLLLGPAGSGRWLEGPGLLRRGADGAWRSFGPDAGGPSSRCYDVAFAEDGTAFVGTIDGVLRFDGERFEPVEGLEHLEARALEIARDGTLWIGQGLLRPGISRYRDGALLPEDPDLRRLTCADLHEARDGRMWITSPMGLFLLGEHGLSEVSREPGAPARSFWPLLPEDDGSLWLGSLGAGLVRFRSTDTVPPRITELASSPGERSGDVRVTWRVVDPWEVTTEDELLVRWRHADDAWSRPSRARSVLLPGLSPGTHLFELEAYDAAGNVAGPVRLEVELPPPWILRPAFVVPVGLALGAGVLLAVTLRRLRRHRREAAERERESLEASERRFRGLVEQASLMFASFDDEERLSYVSPSFEQLLHLEGPPRRLADLFAHGGEEGRRALESLRVAREARRDPAPLELRLRTRDGASRWIYAVQSPRPDLPGAPGGYDLAAVDVTERVEAELERRELEGLRRQTQKMQAIGQLAAGVSHDFNNLLTSVTGNAELLRLELPRQLGSEHPAREQLDSILASTRQGAKLTNQLLAFSRQQKLEPTTLNLSEVVRGMETILGRLIREDVELVLRLRDTDGCVMFDPGQVEQVVLNLAINARDAMPAGGVLTIETSNETLREAAEEVPAGRYVVLRVSDTGIGMDEETRKRAFEPFFTTKGLGEGTGLGLATVHGIVEQSGGVLRVRSTVGDGSTFEVFLPRVDQVPDERPPQAPAEPRGGRERILLCEDDDAVRVMTGRALERFGYDVHATGSPLAVLDRVRREPSVALLVTDVILPEMNGRELAERVRELCPDVRVLFISGYTSNLLDDMDALGVGAAFLEKPFRIEDLLGQVRALLDGAGPEPARGAGADLRAAP